MNDPLVGHCIKEERRDIQMNISTFTTYQPYQSNALIAPMSRGRPNPTRTTSTAMTAIKIPAHVAEFVSVWIVCVNVHEIEIDHNSMVNALIEYYIIIPITRGSVVKNYAIIQLQLLNAIFISHYSSFHFCYKASILAVDYIPCDSMSFTWLGFLVSAWYSTCPARASLTFSWLLRGQ